MIDTGLDTPASREAWGQIFAGAFQGRPVTRVIATHLHPDHVGLAGWIAERFACRLWMTRLEYFQCRLLAADTGRPAPQAALDFYRAAGWDEAVLAQYAARFGGFGRMIHPLPDAYRRISDGQRLRIGAHDWRVIVGAGHSPEHACLHCPDLNLLISGDQVLPRISSNVSVYPTEPDADPLSDWLTSLAKLEQALPAEVLVLPSHNDPFTGLHARLRRLAAGHARGLTRLTHALTQPRRATDVFAAPFGRPISPDLLGMATGESLAHLNHLIGQGLASAERDAAGVIWYRQTAPEA